MTIARLADPTLLRSHCYLNGAWVSAEGGETIAVTNPATGKLVGSVPGMSAAEARRAIDAVAWEEGHGPLGQQGRPQGSHAALQGRNGTSFNL
jgi:hypothetical protein